MLKVQDLPKNIQVSLTEKNSGREWDKEGIRKTGTGNYMVPDPEGWILRKDLEILLKNPQFLGLTIWKSGERAETLVYIFKA